jgi:threonine/homoserine/homoserine lactone efflux protein
MWTILWTGMLLGVGAAISVGPIFVTIIQEAALRGFASSFRVILGSAVADILLLIPALAFIWLIKSVAEASFWVGLVGVGFFLFLSVEAFRDAFRLWHERGTPESVRGWCFWKGLVGNLANPLSWTFWLAVGTPTMLLAYQSAGWSGLSLFTVTWFVVASGLETVIAMVVAHSRHLIGMRGQAIFSGISALMFLLLAVGLLNTSVLPVALF